MERESVLVVDDDEVCRRQCEAILNGASFRVTCAPSGEAAIDLAGRGRSPRGYDLAVLDFVMPGADGLDTFGELRRLAPDLAGILVTGNTSLNVAIKALNQGFSQVIAKPVDSRELLEAVDAALDERRTVLENSRLQALARLYDSLNQLAGLTDRDELCERIVSLAVTETGADRASLMLLAAEDQLRVVAARGHGAEALLGATCPAWQPISGWALKHGLVLELGPNRHLPGEVRAHLRHPEITAAVCLPLYAAGEPLGVLNVSHLSAARGFHPGDVELATVLASDAARSLQRLAFLDERVRRERVSTVGRLASTIIHDLRGPVTIIGGAAEMLAETCRGQESEFTEIEAAVGELEQMCRQLLSFARDTGSLAIETVSLRALADELTEAVGEQVQSAGLGWSAEDVADLPVDLARAELLRVLGELVEVAIPPAPAGGRLALSGTVAAGEAVLALSGTAARAADWWAEVDEPTALASGGAGLCLAILRYVAERHRGRVELTIDGESYRIKLVLPTGQNGRLAG